MLLTAIGHSLELMPRTGFGEEMSQDVGRKIHEKHLLGGGFKYFLFSPLFGEDSQFD